MCTADPRGLDLLPARREVLRYGGLALAGSVAGSLAGQVVWPLDARAAGKATPRRTARHCIFIEMGGAISPMDTWDFKQTRWTPSDLDPVQLRDDLTIPRALFPNLVERMDRVALVRSMRAPELIHFNGQYHTQTGRALNVALAREIPAFGSVIAAELDGERRESDRFPTYVSTYLTRARAGSIGAGFLPTRFSGLDLDPTTVFDSFGGDVEGGRRLLEERFRLLNELAEVSAAERASLGRQASDYRDYYRTAYGLLTDARWPELFQASATDRERYGEDEFGLGCILARNLIEADAGTRFIYIYDGDKWDHHAGIFDRSRRWNHYTTCPRLDRGFTSLLDDLEARPGSEPGRTLLDETLIVVASEFGRTPEMNPVLGRDHYRFAYTTMFAGGGVAGGRVLGRTNEDGSEVVDPGWKHPGQPFMDNTVATIYSALGIDWRKAVHNTPSGREYLYVDTISLGGSEMMFDDEIGDLFA